MIVSMYVTGLKRVFARTALAYTAQSCQVGVYCVLEVCIAHSCDMICLFQVFRGKLQTEQNMSKMQFANSSQSSDQTPSV